MVMSEIADDNQWPESPHEGSKSVDEEKEIKDEEVGEGEEEEEEEEDDVDSAVYEAELEQEIDEEEVQEEVDKLQEESERPIEELIAMYGLPQGSAASGPNAAQSSAGGPSNPVPSTSSGRRTRLATRRRAQDTEKNGPPPTRRCLENSGISAGIGNEGIGNSENGSENKQTSKGNEASVVVMDDDAEKQDEEFYSKMFGTDTAEDDDDNDEDFDPGVDEKKMVQVGEAYQATVPTDLLPYPENERHQHDLSMIWDPAKLPQVQVERFLSRVYCDDLGQQFSDAAIQAKRKSNAVVADDENLLYLLQRCDYDPEEAFLRRKCQSMDEKAFPDYMSLWTEEEVANFERGILHYGKNFHLIHAHKVCKRGVPQLVEFYYWWKKSARYEHFVRAFKLDRRAPSFRDAPSTATIAASSSQPGLEESSPEEEEEQMCIDSTVSHLNGNSNATPESGEYMEGNEEEEEYIPGNYEVGSSIPSSQTTSDPSAAPESPHGESDPDKANQNADQPAFKPWDPNREKFDYEMPRRNPCTVPRQKSPSKGTSRPKRASIMACL